MYHATNTLNSVLSQMEYTGSRVKNIGRGVQLGRDPEKYMPIHILSLDIQTY